MSVILHGYYLEGDLLFFCLTGKDHNDATLTRPFGKKPFFLQGLFPAVV